MRAAPGQTRASMHTDNELRSTDREPPTGPAAVDAVRHRGTRHFRIHDSRIHDSATAGGDSMVETIDSESGSFVAKNRRSVASYEDPMRKNFWNHSAWLPEICFSCRWESLRTGAPGPLYTLRYARVCGPRSWRDVWSRVPDSRRLAQPRRSSVLRAIRSLPRSHSSPQRASCDRTSVPAPGWYISSPN